MLQMLLGPIAGLIGKVIDKAVPDKNEAMRLKFEVTKAMQEMEATELQGAIDIIKAEAQGGSWIQRSWRPILMLWFAALVGAHWLGFTPENLPPEAVAALLDIVKVGIGGYVVGRTAEKSIKAWKEK